MKKYDFVIIGAGIVGMSIAYKLKERAANSTIFSYRVYLILLIWV